MKIFCLFALIHGCRDFEAYNINSQHDAIVDRFCWSLDHIGQIDSWTELKNEVQNIVNMVSGDQDHQLLCNAYLKQLEMKYGWRMKLYISTSC